MRFLLFCIAGFLLGSCSNKKDIYDTPTFSKNNILQAVVEIPAGTNKKIEYDKNLNDFFIDKKYSLIAKQQQWILCSADDIIWIVGDRIDDRFKITTQTKNVYIAEILKDK